MRVDFSQYYVGPDASGAICAASQRQRLPRSRMFIVTGRSDTSSGGAASSELDVAPPELITFCIRYYKYQAPPEPKNCPNSSAHRMRVHARRQVMTRKVRCSLLFVLLFAGDSYSQSPQATISGIVTDSTSAVVRAVQVTAINPATTQRTTVVTNDQGFLSLRDWRSAVTRSRRKRPGSRNS